MIINDVVTGVIAILTGYLLGSLPSAYLLTRWDTGKDIRRMGGGNVGGLNTLREVGLWPAITVIVLDVAKGVAPVAIAYWVLGLSLTQPWVLLAGLASVLGHNWMLWLKFSGGKGMATTIGVLAIAMPLYGYWPGILIFLGVIAIPLAITHNVALSTGTGLLATPFIAWLGIKSGLFTVWSVATGLIIALRFLPTARAAWKRSANKKDFFFDRRKKEQG